jgi:RNA polymerase sigma-70 factor (ECF subfamily)
VGSDAKLLSRIGDQDRGAFRLLFERHGDRVYRFALSLTRNPHLAEEVLQETMMAVWNGAKKFNGRSKVTTWVLGIARNQAYNLLRREERGRRLPETTDRVPDPSGEAEMSVHVERALTTLPEAQREVLHLVFYENLSVRETAELLGLPEGTVKSRMYYARKNLARELA